MKTTVLRSPRLKRQATKLAMELVVVFIGVYAASALSARDAKRAAAERHTQLQAALVREITDITTQTRGVAEMLPKQMAQFDSLVASGARPPLEPWIEPIRVQTHMWESTLQSNALDLFDVPTVYSLSSFYNELNAGFEQLAQLRELSESVLIPNLEKGSDEFYDERGRLRPKYMWYRSGLMRLGMLAGTITAKGDSLVRVLDPPKSE